MSEDLLGPGVYWVDSTTVTMLDYIVQDVMADLGRVLRGPDNSHRGWIEKVLKHFGSEQPKFFQDVTKNSFLYSMFLLQGNPNFSLTLALYFL